MKILFLAPANSVHTVRWVNALSQDNEVNLVSLSNHSQREHIIDKKVKINYLPIAGGKGYYLNGFYMSRIANSFQPDVINVHYASGYGTLARIAHLPNIILSVWGSDVYEFPYQSKVKMRILRKNMQYASRIASTSFAMKRQVERFVKDKKIEVTPFGVDVSLFRKIENEQNEEFTVVLIKTLSKKYGIDTVIKAFDLFEKKIAGQAKLLIYGQGEEQQELEELTRMLGLEKKIFFEGYVKNDLIPYIYSKADVACFGSRQESFGVSAVEAMACEIPVIATAADGFREVVNDGKTGFIVEIDSPAEMCERLYQLYLSKSLRISMGKAGRRRVEELYSWNKNVENMLYVYKKQIMNIRK